MARLADDHDPWANVEDLEGTAHYDALGLSPSASSAQIRAAFRLLARQHHPDKGGQAAAFARLQKAYEVLSDPQARATYDAWAKQLKFRYIPGVSARAAGGEDLLLDEFAKIGIHCDSATQLVVLCEVCGRPSTKICFACDLRFCDFCTRKRHWKGRAGLHWPVVNSPHMRDKLALRELERKRIDDAERFLLEDPSYRSEAQLQDMREFKRAAQEAQAAAEAEATAAGVRVGPGREGGPVWGFHARLARYVMWAQTPAHIYIAAHVPTGFTGRELAVELSASGLLLVQAEDSLPLIRRRLAGRLDTSVPLESFRADDNRLLLMAVAKAPPGPGDDPAAPWDTLFVGDSLGARCLQPPYRLTEGSEENVLELELPFWTQPRDIRVDLSDAGLRVRVQGEPGVDLARTFWSSGDSLSRRPAVVPAESAWSLGEPGPSAAAPGERVRTLMITLAKPPLTQDEITYKSGVRMDNRSAERYGEFPRKGYRYFVEDEDPYELEDALVALTFLERGRAYVPAKPWEQYHAPFKPRGSWAALEAQLSEGARKCLAALTKQLAAAPAPALTGGPADGA